MTEKSENFIVEKIGEAARWEQLGVTAAPKSDDGKPKRLPAATPDYYDFGTYEPIKIINHFNLNFNLGSVIKYVIRAGKKPDNPAVRDLHKAIDFLEFEIRRLEDRRSEDL